MGQSGPAPMAARCNGSPTISSSATSSPRARSTRRTASASTCATSSRRSSCCARGRQHHAAAAGAGLDHRPLRPRGRDRRRRPTRSSTPCTRPSAIRKSSSSARCNQGTCRVLRFLHGDDRPDAARPLRAVMTRSTRQPASRPDPRQSISSDWRRARSTTSAPPRQQRRGQRALRSRRPPVGSQRRPLPHAGPAGRAGDDDRAIGRDDACQIIANRLRFTCSPTRIR